MTGWKVTLANRLAQECKNSRIVSLYDVARAVGMTHIKTQDCVDILNTAAAQVPGYVIAMRPGKNLSVFTGATLVEDGNCILEGEETAGIKAVRRTIKVGGVEVHTSTTWHDYDPDVGNNEGFYQQSIVAHYENGGMSYELHIEDSSHEGMGTEVEVSLYENGKLSARALYGSLVEKCKWTSFDGNNAAHRFAQLVAAELGYRLIPALDERKVLK